MAELFKIHQREVSREDFKTLRGRLESFGGSVEEFAADNQFSLKEITDKIDRFTSGNGRFELSDIWNLREKIGRGAFTDFMDFLGSHHVNLYAETADLQKILLAGRFAVIPEAFWRDRAFVAASITYSAAAYCNAAPDIRFDFEIAGLASAIDPEILKCMPNSVGLAIGKMTIHPENPIFAVEDIHLEVQEPVAKRTLKPPAQTRKLPSPAVATKTPVVKTPPSFPAPH